MRIAYVGVYLAERCYGGPEEGGWWWDREQLVKTIATTPDKARALRTRVSAWCDRENAQRPCYCNTNGIGEYRVRAGEEPPMQLIPEERPHYE